MLRAYASRPHYADHLAPLWDALGRPQGLVGTRDVLAHPSMAERGATAVQRGSGPMLVASYPDLFRMRRFGYGPFILSQHGAGQSYNGDPRTAGSHFFAGARDHDDVALFIVPGPDPYARWRSAYPDARVVIAGNLHPLPERTGPPSRTVAATFHWPWSGSPEGGTAWPEYRRALPKLGKMGWTVLGHWHPRWGGHLRDWYVAHGIEPVESLDDVARRADLLIADNTSALFEFAATDRPVVLLDSTRYRPDVHHGLRFWDAAHVGVRVESAGRDHHTTAGRLMAAVEAAYDDPAPARLARRDALSLVYGPGSVAGAAAAIAQIVG